MRTPSVALTALVFLLVPVLHAEDWTTTEGKTYHNVKDVSHNDECRYIECDEGKVAVEVDVLPPDLQKRFDYDPQAEAALDVYLKRLKIAATANDVRAYATQVKQLLSNPSPLKELTAGVILKLQQQRLIGGGYKSFLLPQAAADDLRHEETILEGLMLMALESKVDPTVDTKKLIAINGVETTERDKETEQSELRLKIWLFVADAENYLRVLYGHTDDEISIDSSVRPILASAGIDSLSIDYLLGKTKYAER